MKKQTIPKTLRISVWEKYNGKNYEGMCYCCKREPLNINNFACGHVISEKHGGDVNLTNLRPICSTCNSSMGCQNMIEFMKKYGFELDDLNEKGSIETETHDDTTEIDIFDAQTKYNGSIETKSVNSLICDYNNDIINLDAIYQRDIVWTTDKQTKFIESIVRKIIPTALIFNTNSDGIMVCIDGKQRMTSIINFVKNKIPLIVDDTPIYYDKVNITDITVSNARTFTIEEKRKFDSTGILVIVYNNLTLSDECEIFHRIQNGCSLTYGETILSLIKDGRTCERFKEYCTDNTKYIEKYLSNKGMRKKTRGEEYEVFSTIFYMICNDTHNIPTRKQLDNFLETLTWQCVKNNYATMIFVANIIFPKIMSSKSIPKINKIKLYVIVYKLCTMIPYEEDEIDYKKCIAVVKQTVIDCDDIAWNKTKECYNTLKRVFIRNWKKLYLS